MRDWLFRKLFPRQYEQIRRFDELFHVSDSPAMSVVAPDGIAFKAIHAYLAHDGDEGSIKCQWLEMPYEEIE